MQNQEQEIKTYTKMLREGLDEVFSSEPYRRFLRLVANNPIYSYRNVLLILRQKPNATKVMGFKAWQGQERCVQQGQQGLRIIAKFEKDEEDDDKQKKPAIPKKQSAWKKDRKFRRISVFDISQTTLMDGVEPPGQMENFSVTADALELFKPALLEGKVDNYSLAIQILQEISPLPFQFQSGMRQEISQDAASIQIRSGMSQLHTVRAIVNQIVQAWRLGACQDREQLEIEAESVAFIVCQYLGLDTSDFSFGHIARYSYGRKQKALELFLDTIQKTAMYFIDTIEGILEARELTFDTSEFFLVSQKRAYRLLSAGSPIYLVFPGEGKLLTYNRKAIEQHEGPFATDPEPYGLPPAAELCK